MGKLIRYFVLSVVLLCAVFIAAKADGSTMTKEEINSKLLSGLTGKPNNSVGYDIYVAIAPNEAESYKWDPYIELYVSSQEATEVDMYFAGNKVETFKVLPYVVRVIKLDYTKCEIRKSETALKQMYRFVSKNAPISVYELSAKSATSDGAMYFPVSAYGTEYIHNSYWENGESPHSYFKSGFIVMCPEDSTTVTINLKSAQNVTYGKTDKGRIPGETWKVTLNKGECYKVCTDAGTIGEFDISGTKITSNKPIGLVSFHERATIPRLMASSRNHLVEVLPPTITWGWEYFSKEFNRAAGGGDLFRIICKDSNTKWHAEWYDLKTGEIKGGDSGTLKESGDFVELVDSPRGRPNKAFQSVNGTSRFWADKPILVFQYSFSTGWDGSNNYDPFYITLCPVENYTNKMNFQVPSNKDFEQNYYNLLALGDSSDTENNAKLLGSIKIMQKIGSQVDTQQVLKSYPQFLTNRLPGTNIYWVTITMTGGAYSIKGDTKFGGYIYGFSSVDGYGWPSGSSFSNVHERDIYPPKSDHTGDQCGNWTIHFTEKNIEKPNTDPNYVRHVDLGVIDAPRLTDTSFNAKIEFPNSGGIFPNNPPQYDYTFTVKPINIKKDMYAIVAISDRAGNLAYDTVSYSAPIITTTPSDTVDFGKRNRLRTKVTKSIFIKNTTPAPMNIYGIYLKYNELNADDKPFIITKGEYAKNLSTPIQLAPKTTREIEVQFNAVNDNSQELDSIIVLTKCDIRYAYPVKGKAIMPVINVSDCNFGSILTNNTRNSGIKVQITNNGTDTLTVYGFTNSAPSQPFTTNVGAAPVVFPFSIAPGKNVGLTNFGLFSPKDSAKYATYIIFSHNGDHDVTGDSVSVWTGVGVDPADVNDARQSSGLRISPNPISLGKFTIELSNDNDSEISNIEIIDESGKVVKTVADITLNSGKVNVDIPELAPGSYFVKIKTANIEYIEKIAVVK